MYLKSLSLRERWHEVTERAVMFVFLPSHRPWRSSPEGASLTYEKSSSSELLFVYKPSSERKVARGA